MKRGKQLGNVRLKLEWAKQHAYRVKTDIQGWADVQSKNLTAVEIGKEYDDRKGCYVFRVTKFEPLPIQWSLVIGDALYNYRAALEYLAWHLVRAGTDPKPRSPKSVQFPIVATPEDFGNSTKNRLPGVKPAHLAVVERHQPYHAAEQPSHHPLSVLVELSNTDKHYELQGAFIRHFGEFRINFVSASDFNFERLEPPEQLRDYFYLGAELALAYGRITGPNPDVRVNFEGSSSICLQNGMWVGDALDKIAEMITEIVNEIEPLL
jgi:hypothetical protein